MASKYDWKDIDWSNMDDDLDRIVAISNYYGGDPDFVLAGGGNTSMKTKDTLYLKASGTSLADIRRDGFVELARERVRDILAESYSRKPIEREEQVKAATLAALLDQESGARPSAEIMLHELVNYKFVVHTHPNLINGLTCAQKGKTIAGELFGDDAIWIDYADPGYTLAKVVQSALARYRKAHRDEDPAIIFIQNHGVFIGAHDPQGIKAVTDGVVAGLEAYMSQKEVSLIFGKPDASFSGGAVQKGRIKGLMPVLRAVLAATEARGNYPIITCNASELVREFVSSEHGEVLARSESFTPDQIVYSKRNYLWISQKSQDEDMQGVAARMEAAVRKFIERHKHMPRIIFIQGIGMFCVGDSKRGADNASALYEDALKIMQNSAAFGGPRFMNGKQAEFIDEWELERYRRKIAAAEASSGRVAGKIAVITGAAQGFGEGIARDLAKEGAYVVIADINLDGAQKLADDLNQQYGHGKAAAAQADVSIEESVENMVTKAVSEYGGIDVFVSNAGVLKAGSVKEMTLKDFEFVTKVNYTGYFLCVKHVAPVMAAQHQYSPAHTSDIIQINSKSGLLGSNKNAAYAGSKFGGIGLTQSFALELVEDGIKVNSICPGNFFDGPLWSDPENGLFVQYLRAGKVSGAKTIEDVRQFYESRVPMGRGCSVQDVMSAIYYIIEQPYETGQAVPVTGGQLMR